MQLDRLTKKFMPYFIVWNWQQLDTYTVKGRWMNNESQWTLNEAVGPRFRYCRVLPLEGRQETKKAREDKQTRVSNTQLTDVAVLANCPICSLYCYQLLDSVAVSAKMDTLLSTFYIWYQITFEVQAKSFHIYTFIMCQYMSNKMQLYTVYFICKLLYIFRAVSSPIIRGTNNCIYSIWY